MSKNALLLLCRIYIQTKNNSKDEKEIIPCLFSHNFYKIDEKLSDQRWDYDLFVECLEVLESYGYIKKYIDNSFRIEEEGIEYVENMLRNTGIALS